MERKQTGCKLSLTLIVIGREACEQLGRAWNNGEWNAAAIAVVW